MNVSVILEMMLSFILYSFAVLDGRKRGLKNRHLAAFVFGFLFDLAGTLNMFRFSGSFQANLHSFLGIFALAGMGFHALLAILAALWKKSVIQAIFHKISLWIYVVWCMAFFSGIVVSSIR